MNLLRAIALVSACSAATLLAGCSRKTKDQAQPSQSANRTPAPVAYYKVDPATAGSVAGTIRYAGSKLRPKLINLSEDPACVAAHAGKAYDESLRVGAGGGLANAFVYISKGLEGKTFEPPAAPVTIDQRGCWFHPRVLGVQTNQVLQIVNSDPVTHNIHPMAQTNREWNHSQGPGDAPLKRRFLKSEIMIPVKCNIHSWMHAFIAVVDHPYYAVTKEDGAFTLGNLPPGTYTLTVWTQTLGSQDQTIVVSPQGHAAARFTFKGK
jgi:hypothetical protein